ncbi:MAG: thioredoxin domain-containing protein [Gammaproteobacteria bacterium]|nr:thioredoxin domain-containing protein [Gammaproteobacteria bacterium]
MLLRLLLLCLAAQAHALENQLHGHASPYLAMHGEDPVAWQDWNAATVALAREQGKLLFISSGYFSCHWCHVMQRESYRDPAIAALLNSRFIPVKLDRELHSALDAYLIDFLEKTQGNAGWPLNVFLTPEGYPLIGATYLPPEQFKTLLTRLDTSWQDERGRLRNLARRTLLQLMLQQPTDASAVLDAAALDAGLLQQALSVADLFEGGFGDQNKFPMTPQLMALLELQVRTPHPQLAEFLALTLDKMAAEGLRDHLAGGFFRYTVDPSWQVPHFEKMLYTQAQLSEVYLRAAEVLQREDFASIARDTLDFVLREMAAPGGGFVASFSAVDGNGVEGGVYLWDIDTLHGLLGEQDTALARRLWRMQDGAMLDAGYLPRRGEAVAAIAAALGVDVDALGERIASVRKRLLDARTARTLPVDDKVLSGWNGLLLAALSRAAQRWPEAGYADAAHKLRDYLRAKAWDGKALRRASSGGDALGKASIEDYAYVAYGMSRYADLQGDPSDRTFVAVLLNLAWQRYAGQGGWRHDDEPLIPGLAEQPAMLEGAVPSPAALLILTALGSDSPRLVALARSAAERARALVQGDPFWYAGHLTALLASAGAERADGAAMTSD